MIKYCTKLGSLLNELIRAVANGGANYWMQSSIPLANVNTVFPKLIAKYNLNDSDHPRKLDLEKGKPVWTMIVYSDPYELGYVKFWLLTTGYKNARRTSDKEIPLIPQLNKDLCKREKLKPIHTANPNDLLRVKEYVLGQYVHYTDLRETFARTHLYPEKFGLTLTSEKLDHLNSEAGSSLSIQSIGRGEKESLVLDGKPTNKLKESFENKRKEFGFIFLQEDYENKKYTPEQVKSLLKSTFGIILPDGTDFNDALKLLTLKYRTAEERHQYIFRCNSNKIVRFTWYLSEDYIEKAYYTLDSAVKVSVRNPEKIEQAFKRLYAKANFHGVRHQIGVISAKTRAKIHKLTPILYKRMVFPTTLHYTRFSKNDISNFQEFIVDTVIVYIEDNKRSVQAEERNKRLKSLRTGIRNKYPQLKNATPAQIEKIINDSGHKLDPFNVEVTELEIYDFLAKHNQMNPNLFSNQF
ncbi:hypothetical protein [Acinetobacter sp. P1(2025)]|uniref:hypothetical protein n=1 Tax=Acinetobacter sp. P1(2025) TaxID=3446120 RepID=UPI003F53480C